MAEMRRYRKGSSSVLSAWPAAAPDPLVENEVLSFSWLRLVTATLFAALSQRTKSTGRHRNLCSRSISDFSGVKFIKLQFVSMLPYIHPVQQLCARQRGAILIYTHLKN